MDKYSTIILSKLSMLTMFLTLLIGCSSVDQNDNEEQENYTYKFHLPMPQATNKDNVIFLTDRAINPFRKISCNWGGLDCFDFSNDFDLKGFSKDDGCDVIYEYVGGRITDELEYNNNGQNDCRLNIRYEYRWDLDNKLLNQIFIEGSGRSMTSQGRVFTYYENGLLESSYTKGMWAQDQIQFFDYDDEENLIAVESRYAQCDTGLDGNHCTLHIAIFKYRGDKLQSVEIQADEVMGGEIREKIKKRDLVFKSDSVITKMKWERPSVSPSPSNIESYRNFVETVNEHRYNL